MLISLKDILTPYLEKDAVIGAFNATIYGDAQPIITAAEKRNAPVIVQVGPMATRHMDLGLWGVLLREMARRASVPVCVHFDHGKKLEDIDAALEAGFTGVMIDGSQLPYEENVAITREVVKRAAKKGVSVEAEIGSVAYKGVEGIKAELSDPETVERFVNDTGVDAIAVAVGTLHRMDAQESHIQWDRLRAIEQCVKIPLVIHGTSGLLDAELVKLQATRVCKVNVGTALRIAYNDEMRKAFADNPDNYVYTELFDRPAKAVEALVTTKLQLMGF